MANNCFDVVCPKEIMFLMRLLYARRYPTLGNIGLSGLIVARKRCLQIYLIFLRVSNLRVADEDVIHYIEREI
jgi:hypothetical protein